MTIAIIVSRRLLGLFLPTLTTGLGLYALLPFFAPALEALGFDRAAHAIYVGFSIACHQLPERSFFLFAYPVAVCQRDVGIYVAMFAGGVAYMRNAAAFGPMPLRLYLLAILPMAIDGSLQVIGVHESTWYLRVTTGALFGGSTVWAFFPRLSRALSDIDASLSYNHAATGRSIVESR